MINQKKSLKKGRTIPMKSNSKTPEEKTKPTFDYQSIKSAGKTFKLNVGELIRFETDTSHYYFLNGVFMPSVTGILDEASPTPYGLKMFWQQNTKEEADRIFETAGDFGTKMHDSFERLLLGEELDLLNEYKSEKEKKAIMAFIDWFKHYTPSEFEAEQPVASKTYQYAGTLDFVGLLPTKFEAGGNKPERWLIDFKTSSGIHLSHQLQVLAYKQAYEESYGVKIDRVGILRVGTTHKGTTKIADGKLKETGKGWEFKEVTGYTIDNFMQFYHIYKNILHGGEIPQPTEILIYPEKVKLLEEIKVEAGVAVLPERRKIPTTEEEQHIAELKGEK